MIGFTIFSIGILYTYMGFFKYQETILKWNKVNAKIKKIYIVEKKTVEHFDDYDDNDDDNEKICIDHNEFKKNQEENNQIKRKVKLQTVVIEKQKNKLKDSDLLEKKLKTAEVKIDNLTVKNVELEKSKIVTTDLLKRIRFDYSYKVLGDEFTNTFYLPWKKNIEQDYEFYKKKTNFDIYYNSDNPSKSNLNLPEEGNSEILLGFVLITCGLYIAYYACPSQNIIKSK